MSYREENADQETRLVAQYAQVHRYFDRLADQAEEERRARWALPPDSTVDDYPAIIAPRRREVMAMLGYPPPGTPVDAEPRLEEVAADEDGTLFRVTLPLLAEGLEAYGLLLRPRRPIPGRALAVAIHGGGGTPELALEMLGPTNYNNMGRRLARRGHTVWMPACYERTTFTGTPITPDLHRALDCRARLVGSTLSALHAYTIIRGTAVMLAWEGLAAAGALAVGLSYGGFRSLLVTALSDQFVACISSCYVNDRRTLLERYALNGGFNDWFYTDTLRVATDVELARLICPRPLCIEVGTQDELFPVEGARRIIGDIQALYAALGVPHRFLFDDFAGGHEFSGVAAFPFLAALGL